MTLPELFLWRILRQRPQGLKFRRQHPIGRYVADFYCNSADMIIEVDGIAHDMGNNPSHDAARDVWLRSLDKRIVHIPAREVLKDPDAVAHSLVAMALAVPPPSALCAATSPGGGGTFRIA